MLVTSAALDHITTVSEMPALHCGAGALVWLIRGSTASIYAIMKHKRPVNEYNTHLAAQ